MSVPCVFDDTEYGHVFSGLFQEGLLCVIILLSSLFEFCIFGFVGLCCSCPLYDKSLYEKGDERTYFSGESLGGGVGVKFLNSVKTPHALDLRVKALTSIGGADWKRTTYDASLAWYLRSEKKSRIFTPVVEMGYRYIDSRTTGLDNMGNFYMSFGIRF